ncbi:MAG: hypothetical protein JWL85_1008 [Candidatus Saccharibacteria bacterium]|nr:hypothetical protein [Candidatus Saccharibacteria bacterium]
MLMLKNTKLLIVSVLWLIGIGVALIPVPALAQGGDVNIPAGCKGGIAGPPEAGTVCPDGSFPRLDSTLPRGCPATADNRGTLSENAKVVCPARPGRVACTYTHATRECRTATNQRVYPPATSAQAQELKKLDTDCKVAVATKDNCRIVGYLVTFINLISIAAGIVFAIMIAVAGLQYTMARENPQAVTEAKHRILNVVIAIAAFLFTYAFLQWLVPGGVF